METKNFYSITKGQLITMWIFGILIFLASSIETGDSTGLNAIGLIGILILFFVIFYTIGWNANRKNIKK
jgi:hypothetical protein